MILLRQYTQEDASSVISWCNNEDTFYKWTAGKLGDYPVSERNFNSLMEFMPYIAYGSTGNVGFFAMRHISENELRFCFIIVAPHTRGKGIAKEMLKKGLDIAFQNPNIKKVSILVLESNPPALACYTSVGFIPSGNVETINLNGKTEKLIELIYIKR